jgi:peptidyl-prolyl cis-trans isomerase D
MMQIIRSQAGKFIVVPTMALFLLWMVYGVIADANTFSNQDAGSVNGEPIPMQQYLQEVENALTQARGTTGGRLSPEQERAVKERTWDQIVERMLLQQEIERRDIRVTDQEIAHAARTQPHPQFMQQDIFQTNGQFDLRKYQAFLASPQADNQTLIGLEQYYRYSLPMQKLQRQILAGSRVSDAELWRSFQDRTETATVEFVTLDLLRLAPGDVKVTDAEVRTFYDAHKDEDQFERPRTARLTVAYIPKTSGPADREATLARVRALRQELVGGADFAAVARRESKDSSAPSGGDLGTFGRGQMVPAFDTVAFSLPVGQISEPVETEFGFHLIQVQERTGDQAKARHILIPIGKSDEELERLDARSDSLHTIAERSGMDRAARAVGATLRRSVAVTEQLPIIPGVGGALEALDWAAAISRDQEAGEHPLSDVIETDQALYVAQLESYTPKGRMTLAEASPQIRRDLVIRRRKEIARRAGEQMVAEVRRGRTLQQVAAARGLSVQTSGPFTRVQPNPELGQANAAIGAAFGTPLNQVSGVVETQTALYIVRPVARVQADRNAFQQQLATLRATQEAQLQQSVLQRWLVSARERAKIKDNREPA